MDPQKTLDELLDAIREGDAATADERLTALITWRRHGGFTPDLTMALNRIREIDARVRDRIAVLTTHAD